MCFCKLYRILFPYVFLENLSKVSEHKIAKKLDVCIEMFV